MMKWINLYIVSSTSITSPIIGMISNLDTSVAKKLEKYYEFKGYRQYNYLLIEKRILGDKKKLCQLINQH